MGKGKKSSGTSKVSMGGRQKANLAHEAKRQEKFKAKRESGKAYEYKSNPYNKKTDYEAWHDEDLKRKEKAKSSKLPYAQLTSIFAKLNNELKKEELAAKAKEAKRKNRKAGN